MPKRGGTVTVWNVGTIGARDFALPVLVFGGVAIGRAKWVWEFDGPGGDGLGVWRLKIGVSWSGDHMVVDGG